MTATDEQTARFTAENMIRKSLAVAGATRDRQVTTTEGRTLRHVELMLDYVTVVLLEALRRENPQRADEMAAWLNEQLADGDCGELVYEMPFFWGEQLAAGLPLSDIGPTDLGASA